MPAVQQAEPKLPAKRNFLRRAPASCCAPASCLALRRRASARRLAVGCLLLFTAAPLLAVWVMRPSPPPPEPVTLARALAELDRGNHAAAGELAKQLEEAGALAEGEEGGPAFVLGVAASRRADRHHDESRSRHSLLAARYFLEARELGFPAGREAEGLFLLGKNLSRAHQWDASQEALEAALPLNAEAASEIARLLAEAYLNDAPPELERASKHNTAYLSAALDAAGRQKALLDQAAIFLRLGRYEEARTALAQIPAESDDHVAAQVLAARVLTAEANDLRTDAGPSPDATQKYEAACQLLEGLLGKLHAGDPRMAPVLYQLGVSNQALGRLSVAREQYAKVQTRFPIALESVAAGVQEAELLRLEHRDDEALETYCTALGSLRSADKYHHAWLTLDELRQRSLSAYHRFFDAAKYDQALQLVQALTRLIDSQVRTELSATARRAWGQAVMAQAEQTVDDEHRKLRQQAEALLRSAGHDFDRLAQLRFTTREYPDDLWASSECFLLAHDYANAQRILELYLQHEPSRRRPLALVRMGESLLSQNRSAAAINYLQEAILVAPADSSSYQGRILASLAHLESNDTATAEKLLLDNLSNDLLTPASLEWRDSLFALGRLFYLTNRYTDAVERLEEAVRRYPQARRCDQCPLFDWRKLPATGPAVARPAGCGAGGKRPQCAFPRSDPVARRGHRGLRRGRPGAGGPHADFAGPGDGAPQLPLHEGGRAVRHGPLRGSRADLFDGDQPLPAFTGSAGRLRARGRLLPAFAASVGSARHDRTGQGSS